MTKYNRKVDYIVAFVIEGAFLDESGHPDEATRKIFVFLQNEQGTWQELSHNIHYINYWEGGSYLSIFLGEGCLVTERMFISTHGDISENREIYLCQNGSLELAKRIDVYNDGTTDGYDVEENDFQNNSVHDKKIILR